jgi:hypothetical protein
LRLIHYIQCSEPALHIAHHTLDKQGSPFPSFSLNTKASRSRHVIEFLVLI